jgi:ketosteroid isomerase-like protein
MSGQTVVDVVREFQPPPGVDIVRLFRRDAEAGEVEALLARLSQFLTDDFVCVFNGVSSGERRGAAGLREVWLDWLGPWDSYRVSDKEFEDLGDGRVLVLVHDFGRRRGTDGEVPLHGAALYTVRDDRIARAEYFAQREDAYAALGLEPRG